MAEKNERSNERSQRAGKFQEAIFDYARLQSNQILQEVKQKQEEELQAARAAIEEEIKEYTRVQLEKANSRISREIAHREQDKKQEILKSRQEITDSVFIEAAKRLQAFTQSQEYLPFLQKLAQGARSAFDAQDVVFLYKKGDEIHQDEIMKAFGRPCSFQEDDSIRVGGLRIKSASLGIVADQSLDSMLADQQEWFALHSDLSVI